MRGFTLVELSVVLTIISLLAGGVVAGKSVMESARLHNVVSEYDKYTRAVRQFQEKYGELPGDMSRATEIWGIAAGTGKDTTCIVTDSRGLSDPKRTCDGNGDGLIFSIIACVSTDIHCYGEQYRAWQHLANAGLLDGSFSGRYTGSASGTTRAGVNVPKSSFDNAAYGFYVHYAMTGNPNYFDLAFTRNVFYYGGEVIGGAGNASTQRFFTPTQFWKIDTKIDDGMPGTGIVITANSAATWQPNCVLLNTPSTARYNIANTGQVCAWLYFPLSEG